MLFNFTLEYQQGKDNGEADALSRMPGKMDEQAIHAIMDDMMAATSGRAKVFHLDGAKVVETCQATARVAMDVLQLVICWN